MIHVKIALTVLMVALNHSASVLSDYCTIALHQNHECHIPSSYSILPRAVPMTFGPPDQHVMYVLYDRTQHVDQGKAGRGRSLDWRVNASSIVHIIIISLE